MGKVITVSKFIAHLGQPFQLVMIRAVVVVAVDVEMTVFLVKLDLIQMLDTSQQIVGAVDELTALRRAAPTSASTGQEVTVLLEHPSEVVK